jgi:hypothetical protein
VEILETRSNAWGQEVLEGVNLELVTIFFMAGAVLIVLHAVISAWRKRSGSAADG